MIYLRIWFPGSGLVTVVVVVVKFVDAGSEETGEDLLESDCDTLFPCGTFDKSKFNLMSFFLKFKENHY